MWSSEWKEIVSIEEMVQKIKIIKEVAPSLVIIARSDAASVEGIDRLIERANAYIEGQVLMQFFQKHWQQKKSLQKLNIHFKFLY